MEHEATLDFDTLGLLKVEKFDSAVAMADTEEGLNILKKSKTLSDKISSLNKSNGNTVSN
jgi:hypothetical protein